jgi:Fic family protein
MPVELYTAPASMEPLFPERGEVALGELAAEVFRRSGVLFGRLPEHTREAVAEVLRYTNCYYSNLIEGHTTHPADIARAMRADYSVEPKKRDLQLEARAHVEVQKAMEAKLRAEPEPALSPHEPEFLSWVHHEFYKNLPEEFRTVRNPETGKVHVVVPGTFRGIEVRVGAHVAPAASCLPAFLARFREAYSAPEIAAHRRVIALAASHHRLAWIHPFVDGNGRVVRLFSHALAIRLGIDGHGLWTISRGLARTKSRYYELLRNADLPREGSLDGRGNLSERHLLAFCTYFLEQMLDQMQFMHDRIRPGQLEKQAAIYVHTRDLFGKHNELALRLIKEAITQGEFARGDASLITGKAVSTARGILGRVMKSGLLVSSSEKGPVRLGLPTEALDTYFPGLFPTLDLG